MCCEDQTDVFLNAAAIPLSSLHCARHISRQRICCSTENFHLKSSLNCSKMRFFCILPSMQMRRLSSALSGTPCLYTCPRSNTNVEIIVTTLTQWLCLRVPSHISALTIRRPILPFKVNALKRAVFGYLTSTRISGQGLFTKGDKVSLENMDRQIYRLIGKATTLAA